MKRSGSRNKFLTCFRPGFHMDDVILDDGFLHRSVSDCSVSTASLNSESSDSDESSVPGHTIQEKKKKSFSRAIKSVFSDCSVSDCSVSTASLNSDNSDSDESSVSGHTILKKKKKSFSRTIKSVFSDLIHPSRAKIRKSQNRGSESPTRTESDLEEYDSIRKGFGSDSETPSISGKNRRTDPEPERRRSDGLSLFLLLLVSVAVTVLGGQLLGVALTSISLNFIPHRRVVVGGSGKGEMRRSPEKGRWSETKYRKQSVGMGGTLKRSQRCQNFQSIINN
ncbi:hypothetical protein LINPERHAP2_LOCUS23721 [Linum perenne]